VRLSRGTVYLFHGSSRPVPTMPLLTPAMQYPQKSKPRLPPTPSVTDHRPNPALSTFPPCHTARTIKYLPPSRSSAPPSLPRMSPPPPSPLPLTPLLFPPHVLMHIPARRPRTPLHSLSLRTLPFALRHSFRRIRQERRFLGSRARGDGLGGEFGEGIVAYVYAWLVLEEKEGGLVRVVGGVGWRSWVR